MEEVPRWITIKRVGDRPKLDPVNFVALLPLGEVEAVLREDGWTSGGFDDPAELEGEPPALRMMKPVFLWFVERLHARLWRRNLVVGNVHLDAVRPAAQLPRLVDHVPDHVAGRDYVAKVFAARGYGVEMTYMANEAEGHDGYAVKIYKSDGGVWT
jgi:hypothetical protein